MTAPASQVQWYLAREGQQYGPLSEAELAKFVELGHLQPNDLLWREGFPDWRPAMVLFPPKRSAAAAAKRPPPDFGAAGVAAFRRRAPVRERPTTERSAPGPADGARAGIRARARRTAAARSAASCARSSWRRSCSAGLAPPSGSPIRIATQLHGVHASCRPWRLSNPVDRKSLEAPPLAGLKGNAKAIDAAMQAAAAVAPHQARVSGLVRAAPEGDRGACRRTARTMRPIGQHLARALVTLRRQQVDNALAAQMPSLKRVAAAFLENLVQLRKTGTDACYAFISQGESSPIIVGLLQGSEHAAPLQAQMVAIVRGHRRRPQDRRASIRSRARPTTTRWRPIWQARLDQGRPAAVLRRAGAGACGAREGVPARARLVRGAARHHGRRGPAAGCWWIPCGPSWPADAARAWLARLWRMR